MKEYEYRCPLLGPEAREQLKKGGEKRERWLRAQLDLAATSLRELEPVTSKHKRTTAKNQFREQIAVLRRKIVGIAVTAAAKGVREFANALLRSQGRLGVHAFSMRQYTALLAGEIRKTLNASELFRAESLLSWQQDPIIETAIQSCEEILAERLKIEGGGLRGGKHVQRNIVNPKGTDHRAWSPIVRDWEAIKCGRNIATGAPVRVNNNETHGMKV